MGFTDEPMVQVAVNSVKCLEPVSGTRVVPQRNFVIHSLFGYKGFGIQ